MSIQVLVNHSWPLLGCLRVHPVTVYQQSSPTSVMVAILWLLTFGCDVSVDVWVKDLVPWLCANGSIQRSVSKITSKMLSVFGDLMLGWSLRRISLAGIIQLIIPIQMSMNAKESNHEGFSWGESGPSASSQRLRCGWASLGQGAGCHAHTRNVWIRNGSSVKSWFRMVAHHGYHQNHQVLVHKSWFIKGFDVSEIRTKKLDNSLRLICCRISGRGGFRWEDSASQRCLQPPRARALETGGFPSELMSGFRGAFLRGSNAPQGYCSNDGFWIGNDEVLVTEAAVSMSRSEVPSLKQSPAMPTIHWTWEFSRFMMCTDVPAGVQRYPGCDCFLVYSFNWIETGDIWFHHFMLHHGPQYSNAPSGYP